ncbi:MAG: hypothetical protein PHS76_06925 [Sphaerochaeta sp.]|nr:hypothetical protein [Sphaerochaeta sp.]
MGASFRGGTHFLLFVSEGMQLPLESLLDAAFHQDSLFSVVDALNLAEPVDVGDQIVP